MSHWNCHPRVRVQALPVPVGIRTICLTVWASSPQAIESTYIPALYLASASFMLDASICDEYEMVWILLVGNALVSQVKSFSQ
jgi:hypothetical protein